MVERMAVIGAGVAGLAAAGALLDAGVAVEVFEKSRGLGGRVATRRALGTAFDHGAQYFTVRDERLASRLAGARDRGALVPLALAWGEGAPAEPAFCAVPGMASLGEWLLGDSTVHREWTVRAITHEGGWWLDDRAGRRAGPFAGLVLAIPAPQAAALLAEPGVFQTALRAVVMEPCTALMLTFVTPLLTPFDIDFRPDAVLPYVCRNSAKSGRPAGEAWVLHADAGFSRVTEATAPDEVVTRLLAALGRRLALTLPPPAGTVLHRWRYARVGTPLGEACLYDAGRRLALCGDWCIGARVEAAFLSGLAAARSLLTSR